MGEVVGAALVAHVPTIMLPEETRREINDGNEITLVPGLHRLKSECLDRLQPDTVIVFDTHWESTFEHIVTAQERRTGKFTSHELPRGMAGIPYDMPGDPELANAHRSPGRGARRLLDPRLRRPVPADLLRHGQRVDVPRRREHAVDQRRVEPVLHDRGLPAVRQADRRRHRAERPARRAAGERRHDAPLLPVPGAAPARELEGAREHPGHRELRGRPARALDDAGRRPRRASSTGCPSTARPRPRGTSATT